MKLKSLISSVSPDQLTQTAAALFYHIAVLKLPCPNSVVIFDGLLCTHLLRSPNLKGSGSLLLMLDHYSTGEKTADQDQGGNHISAQLAGAPKTWFTLMTLYTASLGYSSSSTSAKRTVNT